MDGHMNEALGSSHTNISQNAISLLKNIYATVQSGNIESITERDVDNIKSLINDLRSLNKIRCCARQILETESIKASALRVKLQEFKKQKIEEIFGKNTFNSYHFSSEDKRNLVRMLNEKELKNLEDSLNSIKNTYEENEQALERLTRILKLLRLHELKSTEENSVTLDTLNDCLNNKANKQIFLNEKFEEIEMTEFKTKEVQKLLDQLNSEITEERKNAVRKVIKLEEETRKVKKALDVQHAKNKKLEIPHQEVSEALRSKRFEEFSLSSSVDDLYNQIHESKMKKAALLNKIEKKEIEIKTAEDKRHCGILDEQRYESEKEKLRICLKKKEAEVMKIEKEYIKKAEETAQLQEQINEMLEKIENLNLANKNITDNLKQQAESMKNQLANARKERVQVQRKQRKMHKQIGSFNDEQNLFVRKYQRRINEAKSKFNLLLKQKTDLEKQTDSNKEKFAEIQSTMKVEKEHHDLERMHTIEKIVSLSKLLDESVGMCQQMDKTIQDDLPVLEKLDAKVKRIEVVEAETKSLQVEMNQDIRSLETEINRLTDTNKKLDFDLKLSQKQTTTFEMDYMQKLINQINLLYTNEKNIYTHGCRLKTVEIENARINAGIIKQEQSIQNVCSNWEKIMRFKSKLRNRYQSISDMIAANETTEQKLIQSTIDFYHDLVNVQLTMIAKQCIERDQLLGEFLPELMRKFNEIQQFYAISPLAPPPNSKANNIKALKNDRGEMFESVVDRKTHEQQQQQQQRIKVTTN
ncbi:unnamed protein product [Schistosoma turkestanicum]|nr:unnamed protein product [Schistosoma turkestanicum]